MEVAGFVAAMYSSSGIEQKNCQGTAHSEVGLLRGVNGPDSASKVASMQVLHVTTTGIKTSLFDVPHLDVSEYEHAQLQEAISAGGKSCKGS